MEYHAVVTPRNFTEFLSCTFPTEIIASLDGKSVQRSPVADLECDHEEADTRMFLHARYVAVTSRSKRIVISSPDTMAVM